MGSKSPISSVRRACNASQHQHPIEFFCLRPQGQLCKIAGNNVRYTESDTRFGSLLNYLKSIADYLEDRVAQFTDPVQRDVQQTKIRFEFKESLRLEILRTVMAEIAPGKSESESSEHGDTIEQLAETLEEQQ